MTNIKYIKIQYTSHKKLNYRGNVMLKARLMKFVSRLLSNAPKS